MAAILLAIARVIGETMIVAVAAGSTPNLTLSPLESIQTMTGYMLQVALGDAARGTTDYTSLFAVGALLFLMTSCSTWGRRSSSAASARRTNNERCGIHTGYHPPPRRGQGCQAPGVVARPRAGFS